MKYLNVLHRHRAAYGLEWKLLKMIPLCLVGSTLVPVFVALAGRIFPPDGTESEVAKSLMSLDIFSIAVGLTLWSAVLTVAVGCIVVVVMKGPAYVADGYSPDDAKYQPQCDESE